MPKPDQMKPSDESDDNDTLALNALKELDGFASDTGLDIDKINFSTSLKESSQIKVTEIKDKTTIKSQNSFDKIGTTVSHSNESTKTNNSTYSDVSTPPMDPKSNTTSHVCTRTSKDNQITEADVSYSSDFTEDTDGTTEEMTHWEKWFVMKQRLIRQQAEIEKKKKIVDEQKAEELRQKKAETNRRLQKLWLEKKKMEENSMKAKKKEVEAIDEKREASEHRFENWYLRKLQEKKNQLQHSKELQKYEEAQKEMRKNKNEKAQMDWMKKAKQRPITPRITYAYVGNSVIGFYDSTSHPPPTYINPIPWQS